MPAHGFIDSVQKRADLESADRAEQLTDATLRTLGEVLSEGEIDELSEDLPDELAEALRSPVTDRPEPLPGEEPEGIDAEEFLNRVSQRTDFERSEIQRKVLAVTRTLQQAVGERKLRQVRAQLSADFELVLPPGQLEGTFAEAVREQGPFTSTEEARDAAEATLETLGEPIALGETRDVAAYLPEEPGNWLIDEESEDAHPVDADEFVRQVADRAGVDEETAREYIRAVAAVLSELVIETELERVDAQLGGGYDPLFEPAL